MRKAEDATPVTAGTHEDALPDVAGATAVSGEYCHGTLGAQEVTRASDTSGVRVRYRTREGMRCGAPAVISRAGGWRQMRRTPRMGPNIGWYDVSDLDVSQIETVT